MADVVLDVSAETFPETLNLEVNPTQGLNFIGIARTLVQSARFTGHQNKIVEFEWFTTFGFAESRFQYNVRQLLNNS